MSKSLNIGVVTHYLKSTNFGGNLQAYALCGFLNEQGHRAEQISFELSFCDRSIKSLTRPKRINIFKRVLLSAKYRINYKQILIDKKKNNVDERRVKAFENFNSNIIPHSKELLSIDDAQTVNNKYDVLIAGSDQIWNLSYYSPFFYLEFEGVNKTKIAYGASIAKSNLVKEEIELYKDKTKDFKAVSLREKDAVDMLKENLAVEPQLVVDPVLLLDKTNWDKVCAERIIDEKYIYCYFLGDNKKARKAVEKFAKAKGLKIVTVPYAGGNDAYFHKSFGDVKLYDVGPEQFLALIKHSEYVFTDSFHAVAFSYIYEKQFFVFNRNESGMMNSRIYNICELFGTDERFCSEIDMINYDYISSCTDIDYSAERIELTELIKNSKKFLLDNLE